MRGWFSIALLCALGMFGCAQLLGIETGSRGEGGSAGAGGEGAGGGGAGGEGAGGMGGTGGTGGTPRCGMLDQLVDDFAGTELLPHWNSIAQPEGMISVGNDTLTLNASQGAIEAAIVTTAAARTVTESSVAIDIEHLDLADGSFGFQLGSPDRATWLRFEVTATEVQVQQRLRGQTLNPASITHDATMLEGLRFSEEGGMLRVHICADNVTCPDTTPIFVVPTATVLPEGHAIVTMDASGGPGSDMTAVINSVNPSNGNGTDDDMWCPISTIPQTFATGWAARYEPVGCVLTLDGSAAFDMTLDDSCSVASSQAFNLVGRRIVIQVENVAFAADTYAFIQLSRNASHSVDVALFGTMTTMTGYSDGAGGTPFSAGAHDPSTHPFIELEESGGTLTVRASMTGAPKSFTHVAAIQPQFALNAVQVRLAVGSGGNPVTTSYAVISAE